MAIKMKVSLKEYSAMIARAAVSLEKEGKIDLSKIPPEHLERIVKSLLKTERIKE